jgi:hypothetical protein
VVEARLEASSSTFVLSVKETAELWSEESARAGTKVTYHDHVEPMQWRHLNVFDKEVRDRLCAAARTPWRRRQGVLCHSALGGKQQAFHPGVLGLCPDPDARDAREAHRANPSAASRISL